MGMRAIKTLVWILFVLPLALLFSLVGAMGKDLVVHWLTEVTAKALGVQVPDVAAIISKIWYVLPTAAAVATLYLYHIVQQAFFAPPPSPVFVQEPRSRTNIAINVIGTIAALTVLVFFVGTVLYFGYRDETASVPLKYRELRYLSNYELRERAFSVSGGLVNLNAQYVKRQNEIYSSYHKLETDYESDKAAYEKTLREYNNCRSASGDTRGTSPFRAPHRRPLSRCRTSPRGASGSRRRPHDPCP
jgi:hypothetical protein